MTELRRYNPVAYLVGGVAYACTEQSPDGISMEAREVLAVITERDAEIARLNAQIKRREDWVEEEKAEAAGWKKNEQIEALKTTIAEQQDYHNLLRKGVRDAAEVIEKLKDTIAERDAEVKALETISENITDYYIEREKKLLDSYINEDSELLALRQKVAERDAQIAQLKKFMAFNSRSFEILIEKHDAEVDLLNGLVMAYHEREEKATSTAWQPFSGTPVPCENFDGCGVIQHNDYLVVWCGQEEAAMHLPDNYRLCQLVQP